MPDTFPEARFLPLLLTALAAVGTGAALHMFGGRPGRSWSVPLSSAILFYGLSNYYDLPGWAVLGGMFITPFLFHRLVRRRLEDVARKTERFEAAGMAFRRVRDYSGKHAAVWTSAPEGPVAAPAAHGLEPMVLALDFEGEAEDEFRVVLRAQAARYSPGVLVVHHRDAGAGAAGVLEECDPIEGLPGVGPDMRIRALPGEYAFRLLDIPTIALLHDILGLRTEKREIYAHVNGPQLRIVATDAYGEEDIPKLVKAGAALFQRLRIIGLPEHE